MNNFQFPDEIALQHAAAVIGGIASIRETAVSSGQVWQVVGAKAGAFQPSAAALQNFFQTELGKLKQEVDYLKASLEGRTGSLKPGTRSAAKSVLEWRGEIWDSAHKLTIFSINADTALAGMSANPSQATTLAEALNGRALELARLVVPNNTFDRLQAELVGAFKAAKST
ncbi:hypothetical protein [Stenotrophomonas maltophilia]|uniref:hypothetical protein n=1 Tax=Stenotrophomonas maltophilia TaxID=40324 RepID=UPI000518831D|nr:hypothetical protein [Stenotrophomonas maltophilia]QGL75873.1 hypothetical protein FEO95_09675 [Stenotrophomonas maltophilia]